MSAVEVKSGTAARSGREPNVLPADYYNLLDAQASIPDPDGFEARWRVRFLEAMGKD